MNFIDGPDNTSVFKRESLIAKFHKKGKERHISDSELRRAPDEELEQLAEEVRQSLISIQIRLDRDSKIPKFSSTSKNTPEWVRLTTIAQKFIQELSVRVQNELHRRRDLLKKQEEDLLLHLDERTLSARLLKVMKSALPKRQFREIIREARKLNKLEVSCGVN